MKQYKSWIACLAVSIALSVGCNNSVSPANDSSGPFIIRPASQAADSTGYWCQKILPYSGHDTVSQADTLHNSDTAGAEFLSCDTDDAVVPTPAGEYVYQQNIFQYIYQKNVSPPAVPAPQYITIDSTDCTQSGCKYWVMGIRVDTVEKWSGGMYVGSFIGHPTVVVRFIKTSTVDIGYPNDTVKINYRDSISTASGSTRNNLLSISRSVAMQNLEVTGLATQAGITVTNLAVMLPTLVLNYNSGQAYFTIAISPSVAPGEYTFEFNIKIDGKEYGNIPCTIKVIE